MLACLAAVPTGSGCGIAHERTGAATTDAGRPPDDAIVLRPDAFVPPRDAWTAPFVTAPHPPGPSVPDQGGARIAHVQLVVITFADDPDRASHEAYARWIVSSRWLGATGAEYGVGPGTLLGIVERVEPAPGAITGDEIEALLATGIADGSLPTPPGGSLDEALYVLTFPPRTRITSDLTGVSCESFGGYHDEALARDGRTFAYAVIPSCAVGTAWLSELEVEQEAFSHEVIEAATDAHPFTSPAFQFDAHDPAPSHWLFAGAEVADLCQYRSGPAGLTREDGFVACRVWSNAASMLNDRDPCVPADPGAPFATVSITPATVQVASPGERVTFDVLAWSTVLTPPLDVVAFAGAESALTFAPEVALDRPVLRNGDHATLTVGVPIGAPSGTFGLAYVQVTRGDDLDYVPVAVVVP